MKSETAEMFPNLLHRPLQSLQALPLSFRWEVTRRHPYYLHFWQSAARRYTRESLQLHESKLCDVAIAVLLTIGVTGMPIAPTETAEALGTNQLASGWLDGAVSRPTYRTLAGILASLPLETRVTLGAEMIRSGNPGYVPGADQGDDDSRQKQLIVHLMTVVDPTLDALPNRPIVGLNIYAPLKAISRAVKNIVGNFKKEGGIPEHRWRHEKLPLYLRVWDLREGWVDGEYDAAKELGFKEISLKLRLSMATVANHYASAFLLVCGHPYAFESWMRLFYFLKLHGPLCDACVARRHVETKTRKRHPIHVVAATTLGGNADAAGANLLEKIAGVCGEDFDLLATIQELIQRGFDDSAIITEIDAVNCDAMLKVIHTTRECLDTLPAGARVNAATVARRAQPRRTPPEN